MPELPLNHDEWHALAGHLDRVGVPELVRREPAAYARPLCRPVQLAADTRGCMVGRGFGPAGRNC